MYSDDTVISVKNLSKCFEMYQNPSHRLWQILYMGKKTFYKEFWALKNINFELKKGECIGVIGRNGAGKSTLLQIITGTLQQTTGDVYTKGRVAALLELGSGFNPEFTGRENVYMNAAILGFKRSEIEKKYEEIVNFAAIGDFIDQPVKTYSSGMMVRLAFAVQVVVEPDLLIVDEALSVGDAAFQFKCMTRIKEIVAGGTSVLLVSHDSGMVKSFCNKCLWLKKGEAYAYGDSGKIVDAYAREVRMETEQGQVFLPSQHVEIKNEKMIADTLLKDDGNITLSTAGSEVAWVEDETLDSRVAGCRYGVGGAKVKKIDLLDEQENLLTSVEFNQKVKIRIFFEVEKELDKLSVYYLINDSKHIPLLGYGSYMENGGNCYSLHSGRYVIDFITTFPLTGGVYSITTVLSEPTIHDRAAISFDYLENGFLFSVNPRYPDRIWSSAQVENRVVLKVCKESKL